MDAGQGRAHRNGESRRVHMELLAEVVREGARSGELRAVDPERTARLLAHAASGLVAESLLRGLPFPGEEDVDALLDVLVHGLAAEAQR